MYNILGKSAYWIVNKQLSVMIGLEEVLFLSDLIDKHHYFKTTEQLSKDGYFFNTVDIIEKNIGLRYRKQKRVISNLEDKGIITTELRGMPSKLYFKINYDEIKRLLSFTDSDRKAIVKEAKPKSKMIYKDSFVNKKELDSAIDSIYSEYPAKCSVKNSSTGKSKSSKDKIARLLKEHTVVELIDIINWYVKECEGSNTYMKYFNTFLNNLPDIEEKNIVETNESNKKEIQKLVKWLSSNYIMKEPDDKSNKVVNKLIKLGYANKDFLNQFILKNE